MRELKFRAWRPSNKSMMPSNSLLDLLSLANDNGIPVTPEEVVWMQFTGLQDKNGVNIYENDVIDDQFDCGQLSVILWNDDKACFENKDIKYDAMMKRYYQKPISICVKTITKGAVIGNIHQHPELLEDK